MPDPTLASHKGKLVHLHEDGRRTWADTGLPVIDDPKDVPPAQLPKRWHNPY